MAAGMSIFTLMGEIFIDNEKANKSLQKTETVAEKMGKGLGKGVKTAGKLALGVAGAATAAGGLLLGVSKKSADALDEIHKGSQRMGVTTDAYQEMEYWASQNGLSHGNMEKAVSRLNQRMGEARNGNEKYSNALEKMGVNMDDVRAGTVSTEDAFATSLQTLSQMTNEQDKAALAGELFGTKLAQELLPSLNDSSLSFEDAKQKARDLGLVLSKDSVDAGAKFSDTMDDVKRSMGAIVTNIGAEVMPIFQKGLEWVLKHMPKIQAVFKKVFEKIGEFVNVAIDIFKEHLLPVFISLYEWVKENWPMIQTIIEGVFKAIKFVWENVLQPVLSVLLEVLAGVVNWVSDNWPAISGVFETVFGIINSIWTGILKPVLEALWEILKGIFKFVSTVFSGIGKVFETAFKPISKAVEGVTKLFGWLTDKIKSAWEWLNKWNNEPVHDKSPGDPQDDIDAQNARDAYRTRQAEAMGRTKSTTPSRGPVHGMYNTGIDKIPYDGYRTILHEGEGVLTKEENKDRGNDNLAEKIVQALLDAGITKPASIYLDGREVGKGLIDIVDDGLSQKRENTRIAKGGALI